MNKPTTITIATYAIVNAKGEKYWFDRGFVANLPWHEGYEDKDGWLTEVLNSIKENDPDGHYEIVEHHTKEVVLGTIKG